MKRINMTPQQLKQLQEATTATHTKLVAELIKAGKYNWQAFSGGDGAGACSTSISVRSQKQGKGVGDVMFVMLNKRTLYSDLRENHITGAGISKGSCTKFMDEYCAPEKQNFPMMMSAGAAVRSLYRHSSTEPGS